jgi:hypothetical protein
MFRRKWGRTQHGWGGFDADQIAEKHSIIPDEVLHHLLVLV